MTNLAYPGRMGMIRLASVVALAVLAIACSSSSTSSSSASSSGTSGTDGDAAAGDDAGEAGSRADAGTKDLASPCASDAECASGHCFLGGTDTYCTDTCTKKGQTDPTCQDLGPFFTGKCNLQGLCQKQ